MGRLGPTLTPSGWIVDSRMMSSCASRRKTSFTPCFVILVCGGRSQRACDLALHVLARQRDIKISPTTAASASTRSRLLRPSARHSQSGSQSVTQGGGDGDRGSESPPQGPLPHADDGGSVTARGGSVGLPIVAAPSEDFRSSSALPRAGGFL
jgi:hypothetical protein